MRNYFIYIFSQTLQGPDLLNWHINENQAFFELCKKEGLSLAPRNVVFHVDSVVLLGTSDNGLGHRMKEES